MGLYQNGKSIRFQTSLTTSRYTRKEKTCKTVEGMVGHEPEMKQPFLVVPHSTADKALSVERQMPATCFPWRCFYGDVSPTDYLRGFLYTVALFAHTASFSVLPSQMVLESARLSPALVTTTGTLKNLFPSVSSKQ